MTACAPFVSDLPPPETEKVVRRPDGVALDREPAIPRVSERGQARGVLALREPMGDGAAKEAARSYLVAFLREDLEGLDRLMSPDVSSLDGRASRQALLDGFRTRFRNLDYTKLSPDQVADLDGVERYRLEDLDEGTFDVPRPVAITTGDTLLRIPMSGGRVSGDRYFGDSLILLLRQHDGRVVIVAVGEDDPP